MSLKYRLRNLARSTNELRDKAAPDTPPVERRNGVVEICALVTSVCAVVVAVSTEWSQRTHMRKSVLPLPAISSTQTKDEFSIELRNEGVGPLFVNSISFYDKENTKQESVIVESEFQNAAGEILVYDLEPPTVLRVGAKIKLVRFDADRGNPDHQISNQLLRTKSDGLRIELNYSDVYDTRFEPYVHTVERKYGADIFDLRGFD